MRRIHGISDARRIGLLQPYFSPRTSSRQSRWASICTTVSGPRPSNARNIGIGTESSPPSTTGIASASSKARTAAVIAARLPGGSAGSPGTSPQSTAWSGRTLPMSKS